MQVTNKIYGTPETYPRLNTATNIGSSDTTRSRGRVDYYRELESAAKYGRSNYPTQYPTTQNWEEKLGPKSYKEGVYTADYESGKYKQPDKTYPYLPQKNPKTVHEYVMYGFRTTNMPVATCITNQNLQEYEATIARQPTGTTPQEETNGLEGSWIRRK